MLDQVKALPQILTREVPPEFIDGNGHMNMARYTEIGNEGLLRFLRLIGADVRALRARGFSVVASRQALVYRHELLAGERVAVHAGLYAADGGRIHYFLYTVSLDHDRVACTDERLGVCLDLARRRSAPFPDDVPARLESARLAHAATGWAPELSGAIRIRPAVAAATAAVGEPEGRR